MNDPHRALGGLSLGTHSLGYHGHPSGEDARNVRIRCEKVDGGMRLRGKSGGRRPLEKEQKEGEKEQKKMM